MKALVRPLETTVATRWDQHGDHHAVEKKSMDTDEEIDEIGWLGEQPVYPGDWIIDAGGRFVLIRADVFATKFEIIEEVVE